ncbi:hypothetical protein [Leisingera methylohalidivorans]|uniref:Uncharacterized protein n=1 Tax=Leisingera methylohalidivorans DSM 14336 TaxID=999552 RepID=V9VQ94_9RHOB|nr:hypothetical protein [Leisingera methylohalidivorans]AHD00896.1 hypothetical protein METH_09585 [Leisingera methylohalidivorans DSM 14336]
MNDDPVGLDSRRSNESRMATGFRRHSLKTFAADQKALHRRQDKLEAQFAAEPAASWHQAAIKAQHPTGSCSQQVRPDRP